MIRWTFAFILLSSLSACNEDYYQASPVDPRLPAVSAEGTNTAGAYIDGYAWRVNRSFLSYDNYLSICTNQDIEGTRILMANGFQLVESSLVKSDVGFYLGDLSIHSNNQLLELKDTVIDLDGVSNYGILVTEKLTSDTLRYGVGKLYVRDVIYEPNREMVIFSGTFGFDFKSDGLNHTVYSGRFDYRVQSSNFCYAFDL